MALTSTLFTGLSGLNTNQTRMNVVGNNIANVNTTAFKASRALFKPQFYVTDAAGGPPSAEFGGQNPSQHGLGAVVGAIEKDFSAGSIESTGRDTDMAIDGEGFFVVNSNGSQRYTRDGSFTLNSSHQLVTQGGDFVQGYGVDANGNVITGRLQNVTIPLGAQIAAQATSKIPLTGSLNASGAVATDASVISTQLLQTSGGVPIDNFTLLTDIQDAVTGQSLFDTTPGNDTITLKSLKGSGAFPLPNATFVVDATKTVGDLLDFFNQSLGIDTSVIPSDPSAPLPGAQVSASGDQLIITGNLGSANALTLTNPDQGLFNGSNKVFTLTNDPAHKAAGESANATLYGYDSLGTPISMDVTAVLESKDDTGTTWRFFATSKDNVGGNLLMGNGTLTFDNTGALTASTGTSITIDRSGTGALPDLTINLDFSGIAALSTSTTSTNASIIKEGEADGSPIGSLQGFSVGADGTITGAYSNGLHRTLGQIAVAKFNNPQGLNDEGGNLYSSGPNSGLPVIGPPTTLGLGKIRENALELSNVDLSNEFINLIVASTGFTAASRVITTSDQLLTELLNTNR